MARFRCACAKSRRLTVLSRISQSRSPTAICRRSALAFDVFHLRAHVRGSSACAIHYDESLDARCPAVTPRWRCGCLESRSKFAQYTRTSAFSVIERSDAIQCISGCIVGRSVVVESSCGFIQSRSETAASVQSGTKVQAIVWVGYNNM